MIHAVRRTHTSSLIKPEYGLSRRKIKYITADNMMTMNNVTCYNYTQPLDHFNPGSNDYTFQQRYCIYDYSNPPNKHIHNTNISNDRNTPIFFYTGNESPIDEYVNNTGLIWELGLKFSALVVFAEHRFEGTSVPIDYFYSISSNMGESTNNHGCFTYLTTTQALADYASLISFINPNHDRAVITFGGSYGGMLSSWMRMKYSNMIAGSIASSAPIWGLPKTLINRNNDHYDDDIIMDRASYVVGQALLRNVSDYHSPSSREKVNSSGTKNYCYDNLLSTWPLISYFGQSKLGRQILSDEFRLCSPLQNDDDVISLLQWAQSPWFDLAEGDYPYPSSYIPYALGEGLYDLPAFPLQEACHGSSGLNQDFGVSIEGNRSGVQFDVYYGSNNNSYDDLMLHVDWDKVHWNENDNEPTIKALGVATELFSAVREAVSVWFNVTKSLSCFDIVPAINSINDQLPSFEDFEEEEALQRKLSDISNVCQDKIHKETVWTSLVCNENLNLIMTYARGLGRDFYWPPSHPHDQRHYQDIVSNRTRVEEMYKAMCADPNGIFGYPGMSKVDPYSTFLDDYYGGLRIGQLSNVIFSNGALDPWSAAGVYEETVNEAVEECIINDNDGNEIEYDCKIVQNITRDGSVIALLLDLGAHHLDLMYSRKEDPPCAKVSRLIEEKYISKWIDEWNEGQQYHGSTCFATSNL